MHGSAHDKEQRQRGVLRRGKCVQRALRGVVTRLRTRRTLVATAALVLLLVLTLLALCHARLLSQRPAHRDGAHDTATADAVADDSTTHVAASPTDRWLLRPDTQHGGSVRVMLLMVSTRVGAPLCYALASAYFADLPVVVVGYGARRFVNAMKPSLFLDAMQRAGLRDRDVVLLLDSDILFSGEDMLPFIDDYIARSPATPSALDVRAVRAGTARAPSLYAAEWMCWTPHLFTYRSGHCMLSYKKVDDAAVAFASRTGVTYLVYNESTWPLRYLNTGVSIHRVWSARELLQAYMYYITKNKPKYGESTGWRDDQSVLTLFYNSLRMWEMKHDTLRNRTAAATQRGPHGLRAGQMEIERTGQLSSVIYSTYYVYNRLNDLAWKQKADDTVYSAVYNNDASIYADEVWRQLGSSVRLQQRTLTRAGNGTHTIDLTPPLLYVASQLDVAQKNEPTAVVSPLTWHLTGWRKATRLHRTMQVMPWYMPMRYNATKWQTARLHVVSHNIHFLSGQRSVERVRYGDACQLHHPFLQAATNTTS